MEKKIYDKNKYPESDLTENIIGCAYEVFRQLGYGLPEKTYQKALARALEDKKIGYSREKYGKITFNGVTVGKYFLDFLVEEKIALELKVRNNIYETDTNQLLNYIKSECYPVGLLILFSKTGVKIKRLANTKNLR